MPILCQNFSQIQQLLPKLSTILYTAASFKTISIQYHCVANCIEIHSYEHFFQDHCFSLFPAQWQDSSYSSRPHSTGPLRTNRWPLGSGRVTSPLRWKHPMSPKRDGMPASLVSWALKASSIGSTLRSPQTKNAGKPRKTYSQPSQIL